MTYPASNRLPFLSRCRMRSAPLTLAALGWLLLVPSTTLFSAELSPSWKTRWEKTVEGAAVSPFNGTVSLVNRAPHPNAARGPHQLASFAGGADGGPTAFGGRG